VKINEYFPRNCKNPIGIHIIGSLLRIVLSERFLRKGKVIKSFKLWNCFIYH